MILSLLHIDAILLEARDFYMHVKLLTVRIYADFRKCQD